MSDFSRQDPYQPYQSDDQFPTGRPTDPFAPETTGYTPGYAPADQGYSQGYAPADQGYAPTDEGDGGMKDQAKAKAETAKVEAAQVGQDAKDGAQYVAGIAKDEAKTVASEAGSQAKQLFTQAKSDVQDQAASQQDRLASMLREVADDLQGLLNGQPINTQGLVSSMAGQAEGKVNQFAQFLEGNDPQAVLDEVRTFARRRPGAFLAIAAGVGLLAGRMTRGMRDEAQDDNSALGYQPRAAYGYQPTTTGYDAAPADAGYGPAYTQAQGETYRETTYPQAYAGGQSFAGEQGPAYTQQPYQGQGGQGGDRL